MANKLFGSKSGCFVLIFLLGHIVLVTELMAGPSIHIHQMLSAISRPSVISLCFQHFQIWSRMQRCIFEWQEECLSNVSPFNFYVQVHIVI